MVENHDFKIIKKRKESKGKVSKFVGFKTTWASKIIEKQLDQAKKCPLMYRIVWAAWLSKNTVETQLGENKIVEKALHL